ncbi:MAG: hypothetical protein ACRDNK_04050 [Solirubrobacteraceae bacterium]
MQRIVEREHTVATAHQVAVAQSWRQIQGNRAATERAQSLTPEDPERRRLADDWYQMTDALRKLDDHNDQLPDDKP